MDPGEHSARPEISVVVPCHAEEQVLPELHARLGEVLDALGGSYEIVFVDDGSPDGTRRVLREMAAADARVKWIGLSRNFGHQAALTAGLSRARGEFVISMDADLQHPPSVIPQMLALARQGNAVVLTVRQDAAGTSTFKSLSSRGFYWLLNRLGKVRVDAGSSDFRLLTRPALRALLAMPERHRFLRGMVAWAGFRTASVTFRAAERHAGVPSYSLRRMLRFAADALFSFSTFPLRAAALFGLVVATVGAVYGGYAFWIALFTDTAVPGWTSLLITVLVLGGVQILTLGVLGEYVARVYDEAKRRPLYIEDELHGFDGD